MQLSYIHVFTLKGVGKCGKWVWHISGTARPSSNKTPRELILGRVVLGVFDVLFMCVIEHVLWNNRFLETA